MIHHYTRTSMLVIMVHYSWSPLTSIALIGDENGHFLSLGWLSPKKTRDRQKTDLGQYA